LAGYRVKADIRKKEMNLSRIHGYHHPVDQNAMGLAELHDLFRAMFSGQISAQEGRSVKHMQDVSEVAAVAGVFSLP
jgi:hypothetical protein